MSNVFLIGGAPRSGKTTAIKKLILQKPILAASTDAIRYVLRQSVVKSNYPALFEVSVQGFDSEQNRFMMRKKPEDLIKKQNDESDIVWKSCTDFIKSNIEDGQEVAIEGVAIRPKYIANNNYESIILCNLDDQEQIILKHARSNKYDWLAKYDDDLIKSFSIFNRRLNEFYYEEAREYNVPVAIIKNETFERDIFKAVKRLLS